MNDRAIAGIILLVVALFGLTLFLPIYSPTFYGGWGCPMMGGRGSGGMMGGGFYGGGLAAIFLLDAIFKKKRKINTSSSKQDVSLFHLSSLFNFKYLRGEYVL